MPATFSFTPSTFIPLAVGFFGLGTGYFIWGGQILAGRPPLSPEVNRSMGMWGIWMPGFMQFITGVFIWVGLTWFNVFTRTPANYMVALAFTAYGVHWFALGWRRIVGSSPSPDGWMAMPFAIISGLGCVIFAALRDWPIFILFGLLFLIYVTLIPAAFSESPRALKAHGMAMFANGVWLMWLTWAATLNVVLGWHWWF
jgi:hypothetical protein